MTSATSPTSSEIDNFFAVEFAIENEMENLNINKNEFAEQITKIAFENWAPENLQEVKRELYEMTAQADKSMSERAFVVACFVKLHLFFQSGLGLGMQKEVVSKTLEGFKTEETKTFYKEEMHNLFLQTQKDGSSMLVNNIFVSGWVTNGILEHFNLIKTDSYEKLVKFNSALESKRKIGERLESIQNKANEIYRKAKEMETNSESEKEIEEEELEGISAKKIWVGIATVAVVAFAVYTQSYSS
ncbi:MAG: hypothetical protein K1000chlam3_01799 [Chlamydiae bacterium]|nr:hypothetical protein [Chlamydiota bacterium]